MASITKDKHVFEYSPNNKLVAIIDDDGKLLLWDSETSTLKQSVLLNLEGKANCTVLKWITVKVKRKSLPKSKKSVDEGSNSLKIAIGTSKGTVSIFSVAEGKIEYNLKGNGHSGHVKGIYYDSNNKIYTCGDDATVIIWNIDTLKQLKSFKIGQDIPYSIIGISDSQIITAGKQLTIWNTDTEEAIQTLTGHTSVINILKHFKYNEVDYILSTSKNDRMILLWKLNDKKKITVPFITYITDDTIIYLDYYVIGELLNIIAITKNGQAHYYTNNFNNFKMGTTTKKNNNIEIVSNSKLSITSIPIVIGNIDSIDETNHIINIAYGDKNFLHLEKLILELEIQNKILVRADPRNVKGKSKITNDNNFGMLIPIINDKNVEYTTSTIKPKRLLNMGEMPMETRLENLSVTFDKNKTPQAQNMVQLLMQGLQSKDQNILGITLYATDEKAIQLTLQLLPPSYIPPLVQHLTLLMEKKWIHVHTSIIWLRLLLQTHSSQLMALGLNDLFEHFGGCIGIIEHRVENLKSLSSVRGRLDLLINQINRKNISEAALDNPNLLVYQDTNEDNVNADDSSNSDYWEDSDDEVDNDDDDVTHMEVDKKLSIRR